MDGMGADKRDLVQAIYEQLWESARHMENQRLWFTNIYALVCVGSFAVVGEGLFDRNAWPVLLFLMLLSLLGVGFSVKTQQVLRALRASANYILKRYGLDHYRPMYRHNLPGRLFRISQMYPIFFLFFFCFFLYLMLQAYTDNQGVSLAISAAIFVVVVGVLYISKYDEPVQTDAG